VSVLLGENEEEKPTLPENGIERPEESETSDENDIISTNTIASYAEFSKLLTKEKKVVAFVGTTKNGTSFVVNNVAQVLSKMGISTAILDMTKNKNAYYIYSKNEEQLRKRAAESIYKLKSGMTEGIRVEKNLTVYTSLPGEDKAYNDVEAILTTLVKNYSLILIDCDFSTDIGFFESAQEIYLVQSMDVLTIQPLTAFLRNLKSKNVLKQDKIKIVVNKEQKVKNLPSKVLIGGMAYYNDPSMSYMTELFDKDKVTYCTIPFEMQTYVKYLEGLVDCDISTKAYSKQLNEALRGLAAMIYPLINRQEYSPMGDKETFSEETNDTLKKMKKNKI